LKEKRGGQEDSAAVIVSGWGRGGKWLFYSGPKTCVGHGEEEMTRGDNEKK
jgi:hypothetical protein